jgi:hypothetical protein
MRTLSVALLGVPFMMLAFSGPITYTFTTTATGTLGGTPFTDASIVITASGDTSNITNPFANLFRFTDPAATINISGVGLATFTDLSSVVDNQICNCPSGAVIFGDVALNLGILVDHNVAFTTYDLSTSIGPITSTLAGLSLVPIPTNLGNLSFTANNGTTQFSASAVPEPMSVGLVGLGISAALMCRRRRGRKLAIRTDSKPGLRDEAQRERCR